MGRTKGAVQLIGGARAWQAYEAAANGVKQEVVLSREASGDGSVGTDASTRVDCSSIQ